MAINKNHEFEEVDGIKCAIVEKNASPARVAFLKDLLSFNNYQVVVAASPMPKPATPAPATETTEPTQANSTIQEEPTAPTSFTIGVTDLTFNSTNAVFGRALKTNDGHIVTLAYWQQKDPVSHDTIPYFENK